MSAPVNPPGLKPFGWAFDFLDGVRVVKDWTTSKKADAFHPNHFNQRPVFIGPHTGAEAHPEAPVPEWDNKAYMQAIALLRVKFGISHAIAELNYEQWASTVLEVNKREDQCIKLGDQLRFIERWANHHGQKATMTPQEVLGVIQHYPPIKDITRSYEDGKMPPLPDPWEILALERDQLLAREKACPTMDEAEKRALLRCIQECADVLSLDASASPADVVFAVKALRAKADAK